jgi:hypothetical protein
MIPILELIRLEETVGVGTLGVLKFNKEVFCVTLEPSDEENAPFISSIPAQQYFCVRVTSPRWGETFEVLNVPERDHVLFHPGNRTRDTEGCIIVAEHFGKLGVDRAVLNSGVTFAAFMRRLEGFSKCHLTVIEVY